MKTFAFISRHELTTRQRALAAAQGISLRHVGDMDAFTVNAGDVNRHLYEGAVVVHPAAAMRLSWAFDIGIFEKELSWETPMRPQFEAKRFYIYPIEER